MATWTLDPAHSSASFSVRHMMVTTVRGAIQKVSGTLQLDPDHLSAASVEATLDAASINTGAADRDNHLRSGDFLDVATYPTITFKSSSVYVTGESTAKVTGDLTIRGITREVVLDVEFIGHTQSPFGDHRIGFEGKTRINREDWGLTWNVALETGGVLVGKEITIALDVQAILVPENAPAETAAAV